MLAIILYLFRFVRLQGSGHQAWSPRTEIAKLTRAAFAHDDFISELKMDGFRALADVGPDETRLVSREGNVYPFPAYKPIAFRLARHASLKGQIRVRHAAVSRREGGAFR
jgi:ATP-dependent DNA ligase